MKNGDLQEQLKKELSKIEVEIKELFCQEKICKDVLKIIKGNPRLPKENPFYGWISQGYANMASMGVRRLIDENSTTYSLANIIKRICLNSLYIAKETPSSKDETSICLFCLLQKKLRDTRDKCKPVIKYADKYVAHIDRQRSLKTGTFSDLGEAIKAVGELFKEVYLVINSRTCNELDDRHLNEAIKADWKDIFKEPWIRED